MLGFMGVDVAGPSSAELFEGSSVIGRRRRRWRRWWRRTHLVVGLTVGILMAVVFATGSALVAGYSVDRWVNGDAHQRTSSGSATVPLERIVQTARREAPAEWGEPLRVSMPGQTTYGPEETYEVYFEEPGACLANACGASGPGSTYDTKTHFLYLDPGTGEVLDSRSAPTGHLSLFLWELHAHLLSGRAGLWLVGIAGLVLLVSAVTGLVLWWPLGRNGVGFRVRRRSSGDAFVYDLHNAAGFYVSLGLLVIALTGVVLTAKSLPPFDAAVESAIGARTGARPSPARPLPGAQRLPVDEAVAIARRTFPDGEIAQVRLPSLDAYDGQRRTGVYHVFLTTPRTYGVEWIAQVYVEPWSGRVLGSEDSRQDTVPQRVVHQWIADIHDGTAGGPLGQVLVFLLGLLPAALLVTGWFMWRARRGRRLSRTPADRVA
ncbi:PepSY-associated TM helix domain-containing protein [Actinomycetes bacterium KLBMP 9797]